MSSEKSLATKIRQRSHSLKQDWLYKMGIRKRGYSKKLLRNLEKARREAARSS